MDDPYRMYLVVRRGAFDDLETRGVLAGAAAVACIRRFEQDPERCEALAAWRERPGKVTLRARGGQWTDVLEHEDFTYARDLDGAAAPPPRPRRPGPPRRPALGAQRDADQAAGALLRARAAADHRPAT